MSATFHLAPAGFVPHLLRLTGLNSFRIQKELGVAPASLRDILAGSRPISQFQTPKLARILGIEDEVIWAEIARFNDLAPPSLSVGKILPHPMMGMCRVMDITEDGCTIAAVDGDKVFEGVDPKVFLKVSLDHLLPPAAEVVEDEDDPKPAPKVTSDDGRVAALDVQESAAPEPHVLEPILEAVTELTLRDAAETAVEAAEEAIMEATVETAVEIEAEDQFAAPDDAEVVAFVASDADPVPMEDLVPVSELREAVLEAPVRPRWLDTDYLEDFTWAVPIAVPGGLDLSEVRDDLSPARGDLVEQSVSDGGDAEGDVGEDDPFDLIPAEHRASVVLELVNSSGKSMAAISLEIGAHKAFVNGIIKKGRFLKGERLEAFAHAVGISPDELRQRLLAF